MYNNPYMSMYSPQMTREKIDESITRLQQMKEQLPQNMQAAVPTNLTQNFSLSPAPQFGMRFANTIDDVSKEHVFADTPFFSQDMSVVWVKNNKNQIRTYELKEIIPKDDKDLQIEFLTNKLEQLERIVKDEQFNSNASKTEVPEHTSTDDEPIGKSIKEDKPTSVSRVSTSKKKQSGSE